MSIESLLYHEHKVLHAGKLIVRLVPRSHVPIPIVSFVGETITVNRKHSAHLVGAIIKLGNIYYRVIIFHATPNPLIHSFVVAKYVESAK
jgi:hypothetical protein